MGPRGAAWPPHPVRGGWVMTPLPFSGGRGEPRPRAVPQVCGGPVSVLCALSWGRPVHPCQVLALRACPGPELLRQLLVVVAGPWAEVSHVAGAREPVRVCDCHCFVVTGPVTRPQRQSWERWVRSSLRCECCHRSSELVPPPFQGHCCPQEVRLQPYHKRASWVCLTRLSPQLAPPKARPCLLGQSHR